MSSSKHVCKNTFACTIRGVLKRSSYSSKTTEKVQYKLKLLGKTTKNAEYNIGYSTTKSGTSDLCVSMSSIYPNATSGHTITNYIIYTKE